MIFVDSDWQEKTSYTRLGGFAECTAPNSRKAFNAQIHLKQLGTAVPRDMIHGVWMGFFKVSARGLTQLQEILSELLPTPFTGKQEWRSCSRNYYERTIQLGFSTRSGIGWILIILMMSSRREVFKVRGVNHFRID